MLVSQTDLLPINRTSPFSKLLQSFRAVELVGPRQVGKTTLAPMQGLVVIDEVQHLPARSPGISEPTARRYLDYLTQTFMIPATVTGPHRYTLAPRV